ncbi:MAG: hypothetical protein N2323_00525 [candidate division WOR-3 bacterium]|nr:hypothetical protein [candidate division WOR-3 bacterium]MCX7836429.1 hypothetical protein [candidate division WOR-3 bacterium]MDW8113746.1 hypothetical protein [candidate division WOR-3 bacterium]
MKKFLIFLIFLFISAETLEVKKTPTVKLRVLKPIEEEYYLLTKDTPIKIKVKGPKVLKIYTRLLFLPLDHPEFKNTGSYKILLKTDDKEYIYHFTTQISKQTFDKNRRYYGRWRSINFEVPSGIQEYQLFLFDAKRETVAVRLELKKPSEFREIKVISQIDTTPIKIKLNGPNQFQIRFLTKEKIPITYCIMKNNETILTDTSKKVFLNIDEKETEILIDIKPYEKINKIKIYEKRKF